MSKIVVSQSPSIVVEKEVDGIEMGVLSDGTSFLTGRALSRFCDVAASAIINQAERWRAGDRSSKLAKALVAAGHQQSSLYIPLTKGRRVVHAYPEDVCMAILEYYALDVSPQNVVAMKRYRLLARETLRRFIYAQVGYDPKAAMEASWKHFQDRMVMHELPAGFFSVFRETADFVVAGIRAGMRIDHHTVPDISVGIAWAHYWKENELAKKFGERAQYPHNYPDYFPQSTSNPQMMRIYPDAALANFRRWLGFVYIPSKFPKYLMGKTGEGLMTPEAAKALIATITPKKLTG